MLVNLPNGKTIEMSIEQYLSMTDEDFQYLVSTNSGDEISDPFYGSVLKYGDSYEEDEDVEEIDEDIDLEEEDD